MVDIRSFSLSELVAHGYKYRNSVNNCYASSDSPIGKENWAKYVSRLKDSIFLDGTYSPLVAGGVKKFSRESLFDQILDMYLADLQGYANTNPVVMLPAVFASTALVRYANIDRISEFNTASSALNVLASLGLHLKFGLTDSGVQAFCKEKQKMPADVFVLGLFDICARVPEILNTIYKAIVGEQMRCNNKDDVEMIAEELKFLINNFAINCGSYWGIVDREDKEERWEIVLARQ